ncbi:kinetochore protein Mis14 like-domain-containing protein [Aspergillus crustosus]
MGSSHHRKIELQSPLDFTYLHGNAVALSRQKLDLHLPPSATQSDEPDPMRERVRELVDDFITRTFTTATPSITINGLDSSNPEFPFPDSLTNPTETVEYEPFDGKLAARVTSLYAQLESLTTAVAQLRRDAPGRAARKYAEELRKAIEEEDHDLDSEEEKGEVGEGEDVEMGDADAKQSQSEDTAESNTTTKEKKRRRNPATPQTGWNLHIPLGTDHEAERWRNGEVAEVYEDALRTLLRLQGEEGDNAGSQSDGLDGNALASTVGKAERAGRAVDFVEKI